eukprot:15463062-Alexandrium_andersonii.AAC.1
MRRSPLEFPELQMHLELPKPGNRSTSPSEFSEHPVRTTWRCWSARIMLARSATHLRAILHLQC